MASRKSIDGRIWVTLAYHEEENAAAVIRRFKLEFPNEKLPTEETVKRIYEKFVVTGSVLDHYEGNAGRPSTGISDENVAVLGEFDSPIFNHNLLLILTWTVVFLLLAVEFVK